MGVGRRFSSGRGGGGGGGGGGGRRLTEELRKLVERHKKEYSTVDDIVQRIRRYQNYSRMGHKKLARDVTVILEEEALESSRSRPRKKQKKLVDESEEKLQQIESNYSKKLKLDGLESESDSESESESDSESESRPSSSAVSTSVEEEEEPKFDLMKSMLRESYGAKEAKEKEKEREKEKNIEFEVSTSKKKIDMINGGSKEDDMGRAASSGGGAVEVKDQGPRFRDLGGMERVLKELELEVFVPLYHPHVPRKLGVNPISGILLHGPPGCGKTKLAHAIANETGVPFYKISATEIVSGVSGASEENIRELFSKAYRTAPSIIFIDEIDAIASKRENLQREMERRIVTQLMTCMDDFHKLAHPSDSNSNSEAESADKNPGYVLVIGASNRPDALDPALRRPGRFDREIRLGVPDENARIEILSVLTKKCTLEGSLDLLQIARATPGFVGADLYALVDKAGNLAMQRILDQRKSEISREYTGKERSEEWWKVPWSAEEIEKLSIKMADFEEAAKLVQPSSRREGFSTIPNVKWEDVGGLHSVRNEFELCIVRRIKSPEIYQKFGVNLETGILLYGPPGCGKTLIAKAVANEAGANFIHIKGPELLNKYVGESEMAVRTLFGRARTCSPCILFFDEVDALTTKRGKEGGWVVERLLNQLLIELDGADQRQGVFVIGATNRPEVMDPAVLRPGRFGKLLFVPLPSSDDRGLILETHAKGRPIDPSVDLFSVGKGCENFSGADLKNLMDEAAMAALVEAAGNGGSEGTSFTINENHFQKAFSKISPSVSEKQLQFYKIWSERFKAV